MATMNDENLSTNEGMSSEDKISDIATVATLFPPHTLFGNCEV